MTYVYIQTDRKNTTDKNKILENKNKKILCKILGQGCFLPVKIVLCVCPWK
jgi:hypothetical protein